MPSALIDALIEQGASDLTVVSNNAGNGDTGLASLLGAAGAGIGAFFCPTGFGTPLTDGGRSV